MKSDRLRTIQLNVCNSEEVEKAVETIRSGLKDPEKGKGTVRLRASSVSLFYGSRSMLPSVCWQPGKKAPFFIVKLFLLLSERKWIKLNMPVQ